jgi:TRAP-type C4-dicarboxylate transport system permease small subunit
MTTHSSAGPELESQETNVNRLIAGYCRLLDGLLALALAVMVVLVFGNVVLRYAFNSGITVSEEVSRWLFVWLTFLGAVVALRERAHLGSDMLVSRLGPTGKKICLVAGQVLMFYITVLLLQGSLEQMRINWEVLSPVTGSSMAAFYGVGVVFALSALLILAVDCWRVLSGQVADDDLVMVKESEEQAELEALQAELAREEAAFRSATQALQGSK